MYLSENPATTVTQVKCTHPTLIKEERKEKKRGYGGTYGGEMQHYLGTARV